MGLYESLLREISRGERERKREREREREREQNRRIEDRGQR